MFSALVSLTTPRAVADEARTVGKTHVLDLKHNARRRQRLTDHVARTLAEVYGRTETRDGTGRALLQPFNGSREMTARWDLLGHAALGLFERASQLKLRPVRISKKDHRETVLVFDFNDGDTYLGQLTLSRSRAIVNSFAPREEEKINLALDRKPFFDEKAEPMAEGFVSFTQTFGGPGTEKYCYVPPGFTGEMHKAIDLSQLVHTVPPLIDSLPPQRIKLGQTPKNPAAPHVRAADQISPLTFSPPPASTGTISPLITDARQKMPALGWVTRHHNAQRSELANIKLIGLQHLVGNTAAMLVESGLRPEWTHLWGKDYSIHSPTLEDLNAAGFNAHERPLADDRQRIEQMLIQELSQIDNPQAITKPRYLVLDDGGTMISLVADLVNRRFPHHAHLFTAVEQTTKGIKTATKLQQRGQLPFPVVAVGASWAKKTTSPIYGRAIANEAVSLVRAHRALGHHRLNRVVVFGYGNIGRAVAKSMREMARVIVYDDSPSHLEQARQDGFATETSKDVALSKAEVLISCTGAPTGVPTLKTADLAKLPVRALVINGGSKGEFDLRTPEHRSPDRLESQLAYSPGRLDSQRVYSTHFIPEYSQRETLVYTINQPGHPTQQVWVAKAGGVINFPRTGPNSYGGSAVPEQFIQLDVGLLYLGLLQAVKGGDAGLHDLDATPQRNLFDFVQRQLGQRGRSLTDPLF